MGRKGSVQTARPDGSFAAIHAVVVAAEECGVPTKEAFETAMFLRLCQVPVDYAVGVLVACRRWLQ
jgi:hypothetical protein